ncbi:MAG TPA: DCC1-like thiol-disulfide oxidoreductase family protein [Terriglobales bacterium]|jgi:predicted DCC family thiol-disulfide oxidoreductase YuxK
MADESPKPIILYDGVCGLCTRFNQFVLARDRRDRFRFAALQSQTAARILRRHQVDPQSLDTVYVVLDYDHPHERLLARADAAQYVLRELGGVWSVMGFIFGLLPDSLRNALYRMVARNRYRLFGRLEACMIPDERSRAKFLDT